jgi:hypothetical protein
MRAKTTLYDRDFYAWSREQADLLRAGNVSDADLGNIAEEIESMQVGKAGTDQPADRTALASRQVALPARKARSKLAIERRRPKIGYRGPASGQSEPQTDRCRIDRARLAPRFDRSRNRNGTRSVDVSRDLPLGSRSVVERRLLARITWVRALSEIAAARSAPGDASKHLDRRGEEVVVRTRRLELPPIASEIVWARRCRRDRSATLAGC